MEFRTKTLSERKRERENGEKIEEEILRGKSGMKLKKTNMMVYVDSISYFMF